MNLQEIARGRTGKDEYEFDQIKKKLPKRWKKIPIYIDDYVTYTSLEQGFLTVNVIDLEAKRIVMELMLTPHSWKGINAYSVHTAFVDPNYQGQGIGFALYKGLIDLYDMTLFSLGEHSVGARKLWMYMAQDPKIQAYGFQPNLNDDNEDRLWLVKPDLTKRELSSTGKNPKVYHSYSSSSTIGLLLTKKNGKSNKILKQLLIHLNSKKSKLKPDVLGTTKFKPIELDH